MSELKPCPFCGNKIKIIILDDEFNMHDEKYENEPYSGLQYGLSHVESYNPDCPIATYEGEILGVYGYDTRQEAIEAWNRRVDNDK